MGYSCSAAASYTCQAIEELILAGMPKGTISNYVPLKPHGGFWERGREQSDGAITGSVFKTVAIYTPEERKAAAVKMNMADRPEWIADPAKRSGSIRIEPDGTVTRFPGVDGRLIARAMQIAGERYLETFGTLERTAFAEPAYA